MLLDAVAAVVEAVVEAAEVEVVNQTASQTVLPRQTTSLMGQVVLEVPAIRISQQAMVSVLCIPAGVEVHFSALTHLRARGRMYTPLVLENETVTNSAFIN